MHSLELPIRGIGPYVNSDKTEFICFNQDGLISSLNNNPLKLVDLFICIFAESDDHIHRGQAWPAIDRLMTIWKYESFSNKTKREFFSPVAPSVIMYGCTSCTTTKRIEKKLDRNYKRMLFWTKPDNSIPQNSSCTATYIIRQTIQVWRARHAGEARTNS